MGGCGAHTNLLCSIVVYAPSGAGKARISPLRGPVHPAGLLLALLAGAVISACGSSATSRITAARSSRLAPWTEFARVRRPLDLAGPRANRSLVLAANARLSLLTLAGGATPLAPNPTGYRSPGGEEPYIALSPGGCYGNAVVYALRLTAGRGVVAISSGGIAVALPA